MTNAGEAPDKGSDDRDAQNPEPLTPPPETPQNQPPPFEDINLFTSDTALQEAVTREGGSNVARELVGFGLVCGSSEAYDRARLLGEYPPRLRTHNAQGTRIDEVQYHPAYHDLTAIACSESLHCAPWQHLANNASEVTSDNTPTQDRQVSRAAGLFLAAQVESGHLAALSMTNAAIPAILKEPDLAKSFLPKVLSRSYDAASSPAAEKRSILVGLGFTENQAGSDLRNSITRAVKVGNGGASSLGSTVYSLTGHKWFLSAPMSDAFLMTAATDDGPACFFVPRLREDGGRNGITIQRLKRKLGNRTNATAEVELSGTHGYLIGMPGEGLSVAAAALMQLRLDCSVMAVASMRQATAQALHHAEHRKAFGRPLGEQPLMGQVLADLALDTEAATALVFRLARSFDRRHDEQAGAWMRLMTPVTAYWTSKIAPALTAEALECVGGNAYVEETPIARLYTDASALSLTAGSGNILALDVLRVLQKEPDVVNIVMDDLGAAAGDDPHLRAAHQRIESILQDPRALDLRARTLVEALAVLAAGTILRAHAPSAIADAFIATRMGSFQRQTYGQGIDWADTQAILERATPSN
ncbi:MAG: acyl-CoA dehydrogenase family protein [Filomicrobium sp.]